MVTTPVAIQTQVGMSTLMLLGVRVSSVSAQHADTGGLFRSPGIGEPVAPGAARATP